MTTRTTVGFKHNKDAVLPVTLSLVAFFLSLAGWWLAWLAGLIVLVIWIVLLLFMDYMPHVPHMLLVNLVAAVVAVASELVIVANINHAASCGDSRHDDNDDDNKGGGGGGGCEHLSPPLKMLLAAIAAMLWATVAFMTFRRYRSKNVDDNSSSSDASRV